MYVGYMYVILQPFEIGFSILYAAARAIPMQVTTRAATLILDLKLCIIGLDFTPLQYHLRNLTEQIKLSFPSQKTKESEIQLELVRLQQENQHLVI